MSSDLAEIASDRAIGLNGYSHVALAVGDPGAAREFYRDVLGFADAGTDVLPDCGRHTAVTAVSGQHVALVQRTRDPGLSGTGIHHAFRVTAAARDEILARLARRGVEVRRYREDRPAEESDNLYFADPFGNRLQLVTVAKGAGARSEALIDGIDHAAVQAIDVEWEEKFYVGHLGLPIDHVVGWRTADYVRARLWGEGKEEMAPGARRWDKRYNVMHGKDPVPRPNAQLYVKTGDGVLGIYLADTHFQEPPEEEIVGAPRLAFAVRRECMPALAEKLADWGPIVGPVNHGASAPWRQSLFVRDPGANFIEFCCR